MTTTLNNSAETEAALEATFRHRVRLAGGAAFKMAPTTKGMPDRFVVFPPGRLYLVELKTRTGRLSPAQVVWHQRVGDMGVRVHVLSGREEIIRWVRERVCDYDLPDAPFLPPRPGYRKWTDAEDLAVLDPMRPPDENLAFQLRRTVGAIRSRRKELLQRREEEQ